MAKPERPEPSRKHTLNTWRPPRQSSLRCQPEPQLGAAQPPAEQCEVQEKGGQTVQTQPFSFLRGENLCSLPAELLFQLAPHFDLADAAAKAGKHASALRMYEELLERCPDVGRMAILCSFVVLLDRAVHLRWCAKLRDLSSTLGG
mmetsp:Transcript_61963/g.125944  ORF Transcript_61963/g.125944 Transcript_61963/m.125944 type:complete len:146 (+) Transcript_61963:320-757(+)